MIFKTLAVVHQTWSPMSAVVLGNARILESDQMMAEQEHIQESDVHMTSTSRRVSSIAKSRAW